MKKPQFNLALAIDFETVGYRGVALIDTGFDGHIIINKEIANYLRPNFSKQVSVSIGNNQRVIAKVFDLSVIFETLTQDYCYQVNAIYMPDEPQAIIGSKLIQDICVSENVNLVLDYLEKKLSFVVRWE